MAAQRLSSIPELVDYIISFACWPFPIYDVKETLSACALTCRLWYSISFPHIFHTIYFCHARRVQRFLDVVKMNPNIVHAVRKVKIDGQWCWFGIEWEEQPWIAIVYEMLLDKFSKLETLAIQNAYVDWDDATSEIFSGIRLPTSVLKLSFICCEIDGDFLDHMFRSFLNLQDLSLSHVIFNNPIQVPSNLHLQELTIENGFCDDKLMEDCVLIIDSESAKTISSLEVLFEPTYDEEMVGKLLEVIGPSLEVLKLSVVPTESELNYSALCLSRLTRLRTLHIDLWTDGPHLDFSLLNEIVTTERCKILIKLPKIRYADSMDAFESLAKSLEDMRLTSLEEVRFFYVWPQPSIKITGSPVYMDYHQMSRRLSDIFCKVKQCKVYLTQDDRRNVRVLSG